MLAQLWQSSSFARPADIDVKTAPRLLIEPEISLQKKVQYTACVLKSIETRAPACRMFRRLCGVVDSFSLPLVFSGLTKYHLSRSRGWTCRLPPCPRAKTAAARSQLLPTLLGFAYHVLRGLKTWMSWASCRPACRTSYRALDCACCLLRLAFASSSLTAFYRTRCHRDFALLARTLCHVWHRQ